MPESPQTIVRLAIYARVSTDEQREGHNIDSQVSELERFSREKGWLVTGIYKDEGWSGGVMARPELDRLRDDAHQGKFEAVLVNDVDRLARDVAHLGVIKRDLERRNVRVIFRKLLSDGSPTDNLMVNILGSFAEFERELINDRTRRGRRHKIEVRREYLGSNTAYGYRYVRKDRLHGKEGFLEVIPEEAAVVRQMFQWVDQEGLSARRVLIRLNERRIRPQKGGKSWGKTSVLRVLKNETYAGTWHYYKYQSCEPTNPTGHRSYRKRAKCSLRLRPRTEWLPLQLPESLHLISHQCWQRVQDQIARNRAFSPRNEHHSYLLKGLVRCGACGSCYSGDTSHGDFYYRCTARCKKMGSIKELTLNRVVQQALTEVMLNPDLIMGPLRELENLQAQVKKQRNRDVEALEREMRRVEVEEQRLLDVYRKGVVSADQLKPQLEQLGARRKEIALEREKVEMEKSIPAEQSEKSVAAYCAEAAKNLEAFTDEQWQQLLRTTIKRMDFGGDHVVIQGRIPMAERIDGEIPFHRSASFEGGDRIRGVTLRRSGPVYFNAG